MWILSQQVYIYKSEIKSAHFTDVIQRPSLSESSLLSKIALSIISVS